jgi:excisionase family DNA binding protein
VTEEPAKRRFLTIEQAAEELNSKASLIRNLIKTGELRAIQIGTAPSAHVGVRSSADTCLSALLGTMPADPKVLSILAPGCPFHPLGRATASPSLGFDLPGPRPGTAGPR